MRVLHIISDLSTAGAQTVVMNYLKSWIDSKEIHAAVLPVVRDPNFQNEVNASKLGIKVLRCNYIERTSNSILRPVINWINLQKAIYAAIKEFQPDIIHTHVTPILQYVLLPCLISGVKVKVHTLHSDPEALSKTTIFIGKIAFHLFAYHPICVTEEQARKACKYYSLKKYSIVRNGLDFDKYLFECSKKSARDFFGIPEDAFVFGYVGRLNKIKNIPFLLDVFEQYEKKHPEAMLYLVGSGEEKESIEEIIRIKRLEKKIVLLGIRSEVEIFYKAIDVFMITSFHESSSIVTVEAQLSGAYCVIADTIPSNVIISDQVVRLSLNDDMNKWEKAINREVKTEMNFTDKEEYSLRYNVEKLESIYRGALYGK